MPYGPRHDEVRTVASALYEARHRHTVPDVPLSQLDDREVDALAELIAGELDRRGWFRPLPNTDA